MPMRAFTTTLLAALLLVAHPAGDLSAASRVVHSSAQAVRSTDPDTPPPSTFNEFYPQERALTDCLNNSIPLPNCGSEARGGWAQTTVFAAMLAGLALIGWRVVAASRRARAGVTRTPTATTVRGDGGGDPAP